MWPSPHRLCLARKNRPGGDPIKIRLFLLVLTLMPGALAAQPVAADAYLASIHQGVDSGLYRQLAVGWLDGTLTGPDQQQTWFLGRGQKPDARSTFEIGAASEIFTGLLLAQAAINGKIRLDWPLRDLLPKDFIFTDPRLGAISLRQLATRRSGLPAAPPNLFPADAGDPYAGFDRAAMLTFLANFKLVPGSAAPSYSILDTGVLGYLLGRAYGQRFSVVLVSRVLDPLGMAHSGFGDDTHLLPGFGHGRPAPHWHFGALAGAAGLRATLPDLLRFLQANLTPQQSPLRAALLLSRQPQGNAMQSIGLGWNTVQVADHEQTWPLIWRASRTAGFSVFLGFRTDKQQALVLLADTATDLSGLGIAWLEARTPPPLPPAPPASPSNAELEAYPGLYRIDGGSDFVVHYVAEGLSVQFQGNFPVHLQPEGHDVFAASGDAFVLSFQREGKSVVSALFGHNGTNVLAQRLSVHAPRLPRTALHLDTEALRAYAGDYQLNGDTLLRVAAKNDALSVQPSGQSAFALIAFAPDRFADPRGACEIHFLRNEKREIVELQIVLAGVKRDAKRVAWRAPPTR